MRTRTGAVLLSVLLVVGLSAAVAAAATPDPVKTPGATNAAVTQATVKSTICARGYASSVRNVTSATKQQVFAAYGIGRSAERGYVIDHLIPLEVGGANVVANLWPEPKAESKVKDKEENALHHDVCIGDLTLADAQRIAVGPVATGLAEAKRATGAAGRAKTAAGAAAAQAQAQQQAAIAAYVAAVNQQKLAAYLHGVAEQQAAQQRATRQPPQTSPGGDSSGGGAAPVVHPGAFCAPAGARGVTTAGTPMVCGPASDNRNRWHSA
jgi:hypothetical protein